VSAEGAPLAGVQVRGDGASATSDARGEAVLRLAPGERTLSAAKLGYVGCTVEDEPTRVEVLAREELEEKLFMTPGDIAMLLSETTGLRVQITSPSLGGANVRIQGLRGRYTQVLSDGLPLFGGQMPTIGLLQIPRSTSGRWRSSAGWLRRSTAARHSAE
jgi:iron complex outermembrane receptor protein